MIGMNGSGKSTMLAAIAAREIPIPDHVDMWFLDSEAKPEEVTAVDAVVQVVAQEHERLTDLSQKLLEEDAEKNMDLIADIGDKLDRMDPSTFEARACELLHGLGFSQQMMAKHTKDMSGGWRMRVALAQALFVQPDLLLLDEPTNHLDVHAVTWLEEFLKVWEKTVVIVSHDRAFLNATTTATILCYRK